MAKSPDPQGKVALFSRPAASGPIEIDCSACKQETQVDLLKLARLAFPFTLTNPLRYHHTLLKCPACHRRTWVKLRLARR